MNDTPDIRVGVLAARTFRIDDGLLIPITIATHDTWRTATAVAECHKQRQPYQREPEWIHGDVPDERCQCCIYSFVSVQQVAQQYTFRARSVLAVIEPAGRALEGKLGWRSERATILGLWISGETERRTVAAHYPIVECHPTIASLLAAYPAVDDGGLQALGRAAA